MIVHSYSKTGAWHQKQNRGNDDRLQFWENDRFAAAVVSDGASCCSMASVGAELTCRAAVDFLQIEGERLWTYDDRALVYLLTEHVLYYLERESGQSGLPISEYAGTLMTAFLDKQSGEAILVSLGDGTVFGTQNPGVRVLLQPRQFGGRPCLTTTKNASAAMQILRISFAPGESLVLTTDGFGGAGKRKQITEMLSAGNWAGLSELLDRSDAADDCSFLAVTNTERN